MKVLSVLLLIGVYIMGAYEGDSTAAVILTGLTVAILADGKKVRKCTTRSARTVGRR